VKLVYLRWICLNQRPICARSAIYIIKVLVSPTGC
jgi:hypothetical protein